MPSAPLARLRRWCRTYPSAVWIVVGLHLTVLLGYSVLFVSWRAPDEPEHVDLVLAVVDDLSFPAADERFVSNRVVGTLDLVEFFEGSRNLEAIDAPPRPDRPTFADAGPDTPSLEMNQIAQHPPLYYGLLAVPAALGKGWLAWDQVVHVLRVTSVLMIAWLPLLAYRSAVTLGASQEAGLAAALVPIAIPQLNHIGSSVNNDNLLTLLVGILTVLTLRVSLGDRSRRTAVLVGLVAGLALFTKGFAFVIPPWIVIAYAVGARARMRDAAVRCGQALVGAFLLGGWWWARNLVVAGTVQPSQRRAPTDGLDLDFVFWFRRFSAWIVGRFWGWFGWFDVRIEPRVALVLSLLALAAVAAAFVRGRGARPAMLVALTPLGLLLAIVAALSLWGYARTGRFAGVQGRYLFPGVVGMAAVIGVACDRFGDRARRTAPLVAFLGLGLVNAVALNRIMPHYWGGPGGSRTNQVASIVDWAPWPMPVIAAIWAASLVFGCLAAGAVVGVARRGLPEPDLDPAAVS